MKTNPYRVLKLEQTASKKEIVQAKVIAMKERAFSLHEIAQAEKFLLDPQKRIVADFLLPYVPKVKPNLSLDEEIQEQDEEDATSTDLLFESLLSRGIKPYCSSDYFFCSLILPDMDKILERSLDDLLAPVVLDEGSQIFIQEEVALWQDFLEELKQIRNKYSISESSKLSVNVFPDDLGMKFFRIFSLIFEGFGLMGVLMVLFGVVAYAIAFIVAFAINFFLFLIFLSPLDNLATVLYFYIFLPFLVLLYFGIILTGIFTSDEVTETMRSWLEQEKAIFSQIVHVYWQQTKGFGANFSAYKFFTKLYPTAYVKEVKQARERLSKRINNLIKTRKQKIESFKRQLSSNSLTCKYVSRLSNCERLLLLNALKEKALEAKRHKETERFANILREIGGVELLEILLK
jgi:hypothetical protein